MNIITTTETYYHFSLPDPIIKMMFIQGTTNIENITSYVLKISLRESHRMVDEWLLITSINPIKVHTGAWMYNNSEACSYIFDFQELFNLVSNLTITDILKMKNQ